MLLWTLENAGAVRANAGEGSNDERCGSRR